MCVKFADDPISSLDSSLIGGGVSLTYQLHFSMTDALIFLQLLLLFGFFLSSKFVF